MSAMACWRFLFFLRLPRWRDADGAGRAGTTCLGVSCGGGGGGGGGALEGGGGGGGGGALEGGGGGGGR